MKPSLLTPSLISLGLHGLAAAFLLPSFSSPVSENRVSFEVAWVRTSSLKHSHFCHSHGGGNPVQPPQKTKPLALNKTPWKHIASKSLDPRLRGDDKGGSGNDKGGSGNDKGVQRNDIRGKGDDNEKGKPSQVSQSKAHHPLPSYPWICRKRGEEGEVCLHVHINGEGRVSGVSLAKSSGHALLDETALKAVQTWIFAERNAEKTLSITFRLKVESLSLS